MALAAGTSAAVGEGSPGRRGFFTSSHYVSQQVSLVEKLPTGPNGKHKAKEMIVLPRNSPPQVPTHGGCLHGPPPHPEMPNH